MGQTAELLAKEWNISRAEQDKFALESHQKAVAATKSGRLGEEITPHVLRHTFATWAVMAGVPFGKVARALGTTEQVVEDVFGPHLPEHLRGVVETVSRGGR